MAAKESVERVMGGLSQYDILGYFAPGGATLVTAFLYEFWLVRIKQAPTKLTFLPTYTVATEFASGLTGSSWVVPLIFFFAALGCVYVLGHIIASVAAIVIDRALVGKGYGYPYSRLLELPEKPHSDVTRPFYRCIFFWFNIYIVVRYLLLFGEPDSHLSLSRTILESIATWIGWCLMGLVFVKVLASSKQFLGWSEKYAVAKFAKKVLKAFLTISCAPYLLATNVFGRYLGLKDRFPTEFSNKYKKAFKKRFDLEPEKVGTENFWLSYMDLRAKSSSLVELADNWLRLFSFARNLAAGLYLSFLYCFVVLHLNQTRLSPVESDPLTVLIPLLIFLGSMILLLRYYYLYAGYYTKFVLRGFVYVNIKADSQ